jgi:hypothetical protein
MLKNLKLGQHITVNAYSGFAEGYKDIKGIDPGEKDLGRIRDIMIKSHGNKDAALKLCTQMANAIKEKSKAQRRAAAAYEVFPKEWREDAAMVFLKNF